VTCNRASDAITRFAGSMTFVDLHVLWFACSIGFGVESYPAARPPVNGR
jgi:uncharacterized membrane protein